jgi:hypothetical protein
MKKNVFMVVIASMIAFNVSALTASQAQKEGQNIFSGIVSGHNLAFGKDNLYKETLDLSMWNKNISTMKSFVTKIINENKNFLGMKDSNLTSALTKVDTAEINMVNAIKIARGVLKSPASLSKQVEILTKIKNDMINVQSSLKSPMSSADKEAARKILHQTALFIETTAAKAIKDTQKP